MEKQIIFIKDQFITLGQLLKLTNQFQSGGEIKHFLQTIGVKVNGEVENRRGRKLYDEDVVSFDGKAYIVVSKQQELEEM